MMRLFKSCKKIAMFDEPKKSLSLSANFIRQRFLADFFARGRMADMRFRKLRITWWVIAIIALANLQAFCKEPTKLEILSVKEFGPDVLARSANELIGLGEDKAVKFLMGLKAPIAWTDKNGIDIRERIGWLCRLIFESKDEKPLRFPLFGRLGPPDLPGEKWPKYPLCISNGLIFVLAEGYTIAGPGGEEARDYIRYCQQKGKFRKSKYKIPSREDAKKALAALTSSDRWKKIEWSHYEPGRMYIYNEKMFVRYLNDQLERIKSR
jgi:hypothetical protein